MKKLRFLFPLFFLASFSPLSINGQVSMDKLEAITTNFTITTDKDKKVINPKAQYLLKRAGGNYWNGADSGYGYGYSSWHLELITTTPLVTQKRHHSKRIRTKYLRVEFFDANQQSLGMVDLRNAFTSVLNTSTPSLYSYSLDLKGVPIILLENCSHINITYYEFSHKHEKEKS